MRLIDRDSATATIGNVLMREDSDGLQPLADGPSAYWRWATTALSAGLLGAIVWHLRDLNFREAIPTNPFFWAVLLAYWCAPIIADFVIYRRLWSIPYEGLIALSRRQVGNSLLFDVAGEVYFYSWARRKLRMVASPFGAMKDATILSAMVGNACAIVLVAMSWPFRGSLDLGPAVVPVAAAIGVIGVISIALIIFGKRVFSLTRSELWWVSGIHLIRIAAMAVLIGLAWHFYDPHISWAVWILLATIKLIASRLMLFVNTEVFFASIVINFLGRDSEVQHAVGVVTILILAVHLTAAAILVIGDLIPSRRPKKGASQ